MPKSWRLVGPLAHGASPFIADERLWCAICADETKVETAIGERGGVSVYRRRCQRCGHVLQHGIDRRRLLAREPLPASVIAFIRETGRDRR